MKTKDINEYINLWELKTFFMRYILYWMKFLDDIDDDVEKLVILSYSFLLRLQTNRVWSNKLC